MFTQTLDMTALASTKIWWIPVPVTCRLIMAHLAVETAITTADSGITLTDGTNIIGEITGTFTASAPGDVHEMVRNATTLGKVELGPDLPIKVDCDAAPDAGAGMLTLTFDEFHAGD